MSPRDQVVRAQVPAAEEYAGEFQARFLLFNAMPSWFASSIVHFLGLIILALITIPPQPVNEQIQAYVPPVEQVEEIKDFEIKTMPIDTTLVSGSGFCGGPTSSVWRWTSNAYQSSFPPG